MIINYSAANRNAKTADMIELIYAAAKANKFDFRCLGVQLNIKGARRREIAAKDDIVTIARMALCFINEQLRRPVKLNEIFIGDPNHGGKVLVIKSDNFTDQKKWNVVLI